MVSFPRNAPLIPRENGNDKATGVSLGRVSLDRWQDGDRVGARPRPERVRLGMGNAAAWATCDEMIMIPAPASDAPAHARTLRRGQRHAPPGTRRSRYLAPLAANAPTASRGRSTARPDTASTGCTVLMTSSGAQAASLAGSSRAAQWPWTAPAAAPLVSCVQPRRVP